MNGGESSREDMIASTKLGIWVTRFNYVNGLLEPRTALMTGTTRDGTLHFSDRVAWPITPFIGTLGVAPDREVTTSLDGQGEWGGNLDIRDVCPGHRILLPIHHSGTLFNQGTEPAATSAPTGLPSFSPGGGE